MHDFLNGSKCLASYAVFAELYNSGKKDIYEIIAEFLKETIILNAKYQFDLTAIKTLLNNTYAFNIPENIVKASLKRLDFIDKDNRSYIVRNLQELKSGKLVNDQHKIFKENSQIINRLFEYITLKTGHKLNDIEKGNIVHSFCSFMLDDTNGHKYSDLISAFILESKNDISFSNQLNSIKEGVVLYAGLNYNDNLNAVGSWNTKITIFLETEMLFHFIGYNGEIFQSLFNDFYSLVNEINSSSKNRIVIIKYFKEVKEEIDRFFTKAEHIVLGKDKPNPTITAMNSIIDGCQNASDVLAKKTDFFNFLKSNNIFEENSFKYYNSDNHKNNIEDIATVENLASEKQIENAEDYLRFLNYINILRQGHSDTNFENIGYILLSGSSKTLKISYDESIRTSQTQVPLAVSLSFITNKFWFKLNKGFGGSDLPKTFDVITKAQIVLSKHLNDSIVKKYDELKLQIKENRISQDLIKARIIDLRNQAKKPEDIGENDLPSILSSITEDNLDHFAKSQEERKSRAEKNEKENNDLKNLLQMKDLEITEKLESENILIQKIISEKRTHLEELKATKSAYENQLDSLKIESNRKYKNYKLKLISIIVGYYIVQIALIIKIGWIIMEPFTYILSILPIIFSFFYLLKHQKNFNPKEFLDKKYQFYETQTFRKFNFNIFLLNELDIKIEAYTREIEELIMSQKQ